MNNALKALAPVYLAGAVIALASGLGDIDKVLAAGTYVSVPGPLAAVQLLAAWRAPASRAATVVLALSCSLSVGAIAFDGDFGHAGLGEGQIAFQALQGAVIAAVATLAWARLLLRARREPLAS